VPHPDGPDGVFLFKVPLIFIQATAEVHCFQTMLKKTDSGKMKHMLQAIAEEENRHVEDFQSVYDFINAPNQYLAWGEFNNIDEFHQFGRDVD
jgi:hypothetical protein